MGAYIVRRLIQAIFTLIGVLLLTFLLFRVVAGDIASAHLPQQATQQQKADWEEKHGYNKPKWLNFKEGEPWWDSQFYFYLSRTVTFQTYSLMNDKSLIQIIREKAPYSLMLTVPEMALGWTFGMLISVIVAYYRGRWIDHVGVFLAVLGMCIPFLAFIIFGQLLVFYFHADLAYGLSHPLAIYVPICVGVLAGLGHSVRFYRAIIVDECGRDYVRTALAKGLPVWLVMFKHILKNAMLPILTNLIMQIPFLIMGNLLLESFFGLPGLGDLFLSSIQGRDEPVISGLTFLTALIYVLGNLLTDISYALFDPRVKLS